MKVGLFDSGVGGISVLRKLVSSFPYFDYIYFGDIANSPYGIKSDQELSVIVSRILNFLESKEVDVIVAACNTADSVAKRCLEGGSDIPYVGIVENVKRVVKTDRIGVVATESTVRSRIYDRVLGKRIVYKRSLQPLVLAIEKDFENKDLITSIIRKGLKDVEGYGVKELILGCTHFSLVYSVFKKVLPTLDIVDPADGVVELMEGMFEKKIDDYKKKVRVEFYTSGEPEDFERRIRNFIDLENLAFSISKVEFGGVEGETGIYNFWIVRCGKE